jgi:hypothetical protein
MGRGTLFALTSVAPPAAAEQFSSEELAKPSPTSLRTGKFGFRGGGRR